MEQSITGDEARDAPHFEAVPPAAGSLPQTWLDIARPYLTRPGWKDRLHRRIAAWSGAASDAWMALSLATATGVAFLSNAIQAHVHAKDGRIMVQPPTGRALLYMFLGPLQFLTTALAIVALSALLTSRLGYGSFGERFLRTLRPLALALVPISLYILLATLFNLPASLVPDDTALGELLAVVCSLPALTCVVYLLNLAFAAASVGAYRFARRRVIALLVALAWLGIMFLFYWAESWLASALALH